MGRVPLLVISLAGGLVLFAGTSAAILAAQGRLGALVGHPPDAHAKTPSHEKSPAAPKSAGLDGALRGPDTAGHATPADGKASATEAAKDGGAESHAEPAKQSPAPTKLPPREATASLASHFELPSPFSPAELDELVRSLQEDRAAYEKLRLEATADKAANERDRLDVERRAAELEEVRKRLEIEKQEILAKVAEWEKRSARLEAGEDKFVKAQSERVATLDTPKAMTLILELDERLAAQLLARLSPRKAGEILAAMDPERRVALTRALQAAANAESGPAEKKGSR